MFELKKILLPIDFSGGSAAVAPYAKALAEQFRSELLLMHVEHPRRLLGGLRRRAQTDTAIQEAFDAELEALSNSEFQGAAVERQVVEGEPAAKIVELAQAQQVDLIMMPTRGCGRYRRFLLGSVTAKVLHDSDCPVWTSVHLEAAIHKQPALRKIACAIDLGPHTEKVLQWASGMATAFRAQLLVLHAAAPLDPLIEEASVPLASVQRMEEAQQKLNDRVHKMKLQAEIEVETGAVSEVIYRHTARFPADLLVIGRHAAPGIAGRLHPHAYAIIRDSPCPVVSI
jgi:nucleotide-binding universal stress UspA family protein